MRLLNLVLGVLALATTVARAEDTDPQLMQKRCKFESQLTKPMSLGYLLYLPKDYKPEDKARKWPLMLFLHGSGDVESRFERWCDVVGSLPRKQTRVLTWPIATVFGFIAQPKTHIFLKPNVTRVAAGKYGFVFRYASKPSWPVYASLIKFAGVVRRDLRDLRPRDMIDIQSFIWVQGSDEYA